MEEMKNKASEVAHQAKQTLIGIYTKFDEVTSVDRQPTPLRPVIHQVAIFLNRLHASKIIIQEKIKDEVQNSVSPPVKFAYSTLLKYPEIFAYSTGLLGVAIAARSGGGIKRALTFGAAGTVAGGLALASM